MPIGIGLMPIVIGLIGQCPLAGLPMPIGMAYWSYANSHHWPYRAMSAGLPMPIGIGLIYANSHWSYRAT